MKIFIAGKARDGGISRVAKLYEQFEAIGCEVLYKWADESIELDKPYRENLDSQINREVQKSALEAATTAQVFILIGEPELSGAFIELGAFLGSLKEGNHRKAYIIDEGVDTTVFETNPNVEIVDDIDDVFKAIKSKVSNS